MITPSASQAKTLLHKTTDISKRTTKSSSPWSLKAGKNQNLVMTSRCVRQQSRDCSHSVPTTTRLQSSPDLEPQLSSRRLEDLAADEHFEEFTPLYSSPKGTCITAEYVSTIPTWTFVCSALSSSSTIALTVHSLGYCWFLDPSRRQEEFKGARRGQPHCLVPGCAQLGDLDVCGASSTQSQTVRFGLPHYVWRTKIVQRVVATYLTAIFWPLETVPSGCTQAKSNGAIPK